MSEPINTGGPAFPVPLNPGQSWQGMAPCDGMTLRDYFAAQAMQGMLPRPGSIDPKQDAEFAYKMADAMLKAREGGAR
jgi:hypothetical protein